MRTTLILLVAGLLGGCVNVQPIVRGEDPRDLPGTPPGTAPPGTMDPRFPESDRTAGVHPARRLCRVRGVPSGYIATSYERSGDCPPADADDGYNVAIVEYYADRPVGATISVCADQRIPAQWTRTPDEPVTSCPGARVDAGAPTSVTIRRQY